VDPLHLPKKVKQPQAQVRLDSHTIRRSPSPGKANPSLPLPRPAKIQVAPIEAFA
jgi:hypothetical protein